MERYEERYVDRCPLWRSPRWRGSSPWESSWLRCRWHICIYTGLERGVEIYRSVPVAAATEIEGLVAMGKLVAKMQVRHMYICMSREKSIEM